MGTLVHLIQDESGSRRRGFSGAVIFSGELFWGVMYWAWRGGREIPNVEASSSCVLLVSCGFCTQVFYFLFGLAGAPGARSGGGGFLLCRLQWQAYSTTKVRFSAFLNHSGGVGGRDDSPIPAYKRQS